MIKMMMQSYSLHNTKYWNSLEFSMNIFSSQFKRYEWLFLDSTKVYTKVSMSNTDSKNVPMKYILKRIRSIFQNRCICFSWDSIKLRL